MSRELLFFLAAIVAAIVSLLGFFHYVIGMDFLSAAMVLAVLVVGAFTGGGNV